MTDKSLALLFPKRLYYYLIPSYYRIIFIYIHIYIIMCNTISVPPPLYINRHRSIPNTFDGSVSVPLISTLSLQLARDDGKFSPRSRLSNVRVPLTQINRQKRFLTARLFFSPRRPGC